MSQHNTSVTTQQCHNITVSQHNSVMTQQSHNTKCVIFQEKILKLLKCYNFLWVQRRHNCSPVASFTNCIMPLYLLKVQLQMFLSIPITRKCQILSCDTLVTMSDILCTSWLSSNTKKSFFLYLNSWITGGRNFVAIESFKSTSILAGGASCPTMLFSCFQTKPSGLDESWLPSTMQKELKLFK